MLFATDNYCHYDLQGQKLSPAADVPGAQPMQLREPGSQERGAVPGQAWIVVAPVKTRHRRVRSQLEGLPGAEPADVVAHVARPAGHLVEALDLVHDEPGWASAIAAPAGVDHSSMPLPIHRSKIDSSAL